MQEITATTNYSMQKSFLLILCPCILQQAKEGYNMQQGSQGRNQTRDVALNLSATKAFLPASTLISKANQLPQMSIMMTSSYFTWDLQRFGTIWFRVTYHIYNTNNAIIFILLFCLLCVNLTHTVLMYWIVEVLPCWSQTNMLPILLVNWTTDK